MIFLSLFLGALSWTFLEYVIHRWLGHDSRFKPNFFSHEHTRHHSQGNYFAPFKIKVLMAAAGIAILAPPALLLLDSLNGIFWVIGLVGMYLVYERFHNHLHVHPGFGPYGRWARRHHFYHHFMNPHVNHGVTTPIWDIVFGTYRTAPRIRVPEKLAMLWLQTEEGFEIPAQLSCDYELVPLDKAPQA
ncbi:MAG: sterol desaturase family protein [Planctomycetota bacterium]|jgi:sterol desaturase/sphingolipid hydroxylase (fatty acid hydroxylase superfamily)|nr:sterol desaturase family protein [Planctomycetota bacterium]